MLVICALSKGSRIYYLPVVEPSQKNEHRSTDQQEDNHLPITRSLQVCAHSITPHLINESRLCFCLSSIKGKRCFTMTICTVFGSVNISPSLRALLAI